MRKIFNIGVAGMVLSGMALDSRMWWLALLFVAAFTAVAAFGYMHLEASDLEPLRVQEKKEANRQRTFSEWLDGTAVTMKMP